MRCLGGSSDFLPGLFMLGTQPARLVGWKVQDDLAQMSGFLWLAVKDLSFPHGLSPSSRTELLALIVTSGQYSGRTRGKCKVSEI